jgi:hypothetical protein
MSSTLNGIVNSLLKPETCDNVDNDCNACTDEGFVHYANVGQTCCTWATGPQRTTCLNNYQASISAANPQGNRALLPCTTLVQQADSSNWLCYNPGETCDGVDNNATARSTRDSTSAAARRIARPPRLATDRTTTAMASSTTVPATAASGAPRFATAATTTTTA